MAFTRTKAVLDALEAKLKTLTFPEGHAFAGESVFKAVRLYDIENIEQGINDLFEYDGRLCFVVPVAEGFKHTQNGASLSSVRLGEYSLLMSDEDYEPGIPAFMGDDATYPGLINLKDEVLEQILGESLGLRNVVVMPVQGNAYRFANSEKDLEQSREGWVMQIDISMGRAQTKLGAGTTINRN